MRTTYFTLRAIDVQVYAALRLPNISASWTAAARVAPCPWGPYCSTPPHASVPWPPPAPPWPTPPPTPPPTTPYWPAGRPAPSSRAAQPRLAGRVAPRLVPPPATAGNRPDPHPLPRPAPARPRRGLPLPGPGRHTTPFHADATAYVVRAGRRCTVGLVAVRRGDALAEVIRRLLAQAAQAAVRPRYLLLDRGFCSVDVIRYRQAGRRAFLMPLVRRGRKATHPDGPGGSPVLAAWTKSGGGRYTLTNGRKRTAPCAVGVRCRNRRGVRGRHGREALVYAYGGGLRPSSYRGVPQTYRSRFGIETRYRQLNQARIRTCTRDPLLRLLYVVIALVLRNVWVWLHWERRATRRHGGRRLNLTRWTFRHLLLCLPHVAEFRLGVSDGVYVQEPA